MGTKRELARRTNQKGVEIRSADHLVNLTNAARGGYEKRLRRAHSPHACGP